MLRKLMALVAASFVAANILAFAGVANANPVGTVAEKLARKGLKKIFKKSVKPGEIGDGTLNGPNHKKFMREKEHRRLMKKYKKELQRSVPRTYEMPSETPTIRSRNQSDDIGAERARREAERAIQRLERSYNR